MPLPTRSKSGSSVIKSTSPSSKLKNGAKSNSNHSSSNKLNASSVTGNSSNANATVSTTPKLKGILKRPTTTNPKTHTRKLTFHNKKKTKRIPNVASMPSDILEEIWWSADDYDDIMRSFEYTVFMMEAGESKTVEDDGEHCTRGLELRTEAGKWARFEHKRDCYNAVLDEQDRQWNAGEDNQDKIANSCREVTAKTQRIACRKGMQDEKEIAEYVAETRKTIKRLNSSISKKNGTTSTANTNTAATTTTAAGKILPSRAKSSSTGSMPNKRRPPRTDSGKARIEKSPPRKPERVLSGKTDRTDPAPPNNSNMAQGAPKTPKRSVSNSSSTTTNSATANSNKPTPTNSAKSNNLRIPQRQTFSNTSKSASPKTTVSPSTSAKSGRSSPANSTSAKKSTSSKTNTNNNASLGSLPKMPKRSISNSSAASTGGDSMDSSNSDGKGRINAAALAKFGG